MQTALYRIHSGTSSLLIWQLGKKTNQKKHTAIKACLVSDLGLYKDHAAICLGFRGFLLPFWEGAASRGGSDAAGHLDNNLS